MSKGNLKPEWEIFFDTLAKVFSPTDRRNFNNISNILQVFGLCIAYNHPIDFGKIILKEILRKLGPLMGRSVENNDKVGCFYPRFLMLFLNDKMPEADKNFYFNSEQALVKKASTKLVNKLAKATKHNQVPLVVTPFMSERFNAQLAPYQFMWLNQYNNNSSNLYYYNNQNHNHHLSNPLLTPLSTNNNSSPLKMSPCNTTSSNNNHLYLNPYYHSRKHNLSLKHNQPHNPYRQTLQSTLSSEPSRTTYR